MNPWFDDDLQLQFSVDDHNCLQLDEFAEDHSQDYLDGYPGRWCGFMSSCTECINAPTRCTVPTQMYPYTGIDQARFAINPNNS